MRFIQLVRSPVGVSCYFEAGTGHVGFADGFYLLDAVVEADLVEESENGVQIIDDFPLLGGENGFNIADVNKNNCDLPSVDRLRVIVNFAMDESRQEKFQDLIGMLGLNF